VATNVASILAGDYNGSGGREIVDIAEGAEPTSFWESIGGRADYARFSSYAQQPKDPRLFHCSDAFGPFTVEEVTYIS
jgi:hypothetical protein